MIVEEQAAALRLHAPWLIYDSAERFFAKPAENPSPAPTWVGDNPDVSYGRVAREGADVWLQYWYWYAMNRPLLIGRHEGDWEGVQIELGPDGPARVVYAQHAGGELAPWSAVEMRDGRPVVYVANGTHASYLTRGWHRRTRIVLERANGQGRAVVPELVVMPEHGWTTREGKWGRSDHSPASPGRQWRWRQPSSWAAYVERLGV